MQPKPTMNDVPWYRSPLHWLAAFIFCFACGPAVVMLIPWVPLGEAVSKRVQEIASVFAILVAIGLPVALRFVDHRNKAEADRLSMLRRLYLLHGLSEEVSTAYHRVVHAARKQDTLTPLDPLRKVDWVERLRTIDVLGLPRPALDAVTSLRQQIFALDHLRDRYVLGELPLEEATAAYKRVDLIESGLYNLYGTAQWRRPLPPSDEQIAQQAILKKRRGQ